MYLRALIISLLVATTTMSHAQLSTTNLSIENIQADSLADLGHYKQALDLYEKAYQGYLSNDNWYNQASVLIEMANMRVRISRFAEAEATAQKVLSLNKEHLNDNILVEAGAIRALGLVYDYSNKFDKALEYYRKSQQLYLDTLGDSHYQVAAGYNNISAVYHFQAKYDSSILYLRKSFNIISNSLGLENRRIMRYYGNFAVNFRRLGQYDSALHYFQKEIDLTIKLFGENSPFLAGTYTSLGQFLTELGENVEAIERCNQALDIDLNNAEENHQRVASNYNNLGMAYINSGSNDLAYDYFQKALSIQHKLFESFNIQFAITYNNLGRYWLNSAEPDKAIYNFKLATENLVQTIGYDHPFVAEVFINLALAYTDLIRYDSAQFYLDEAVEIQVSAHGEVHKGIAATRANQADLYFETGNFVKGMSSSKDAIALFRAVFGTKHPDISKNLHIRALQYAKLNYIDSALTTIQSAIIANSPNFADTAVDKNPKNLDCLDFAQQVKNFDLKAQILHQFYAQDRLPKRLQNIIEVSKKADSLISNTIDQSISFEDRIEYVGTAKDLYKSAVKASFEKYNNSKLPQDLEDVFFFIERSKSTVLRFSLNDEDAKRFSGIPDSLLILEDRLKSDQSNFRSRLLNTKDPSVNSYFEGRLFAVDRKMDSIQSIFRSDYKDYYQLKYQNDVPNIERVQGQLSGDKAIIEYFEGDSALYILSLAQKKKKLYRIPLDNSIEAPLNFFTSLEENSKSGSIQDYKSQSYKIYEHLLKDVVSDLSPDIESLIIVPSDRFASLPFDILIKSNAGQEFRNLEYLFQDYAISYAYSASLLFQEQRETDVSGKLLAFAPSYPSTQTNTVVEKMNDAFRNELVPLEWNSEEATKVASEFNGVVLIDQEATEANFKAHSPNFQILHLAMHALVDNEESMQSKLVFTLNKDSIEDGMLHTHELLNMHIPAELVVLSACNTGIGEIQNGEGVMSLARGFAYAGVPSIVMSHWNANDHTTAHLMTSFYEYLSQDYPKNVALQKAKLDFLESANEFESNPYYWGGFVLLGDARPLNKNDAFIWWIVMASLGLIFISMLLITRGNKKGS